LYIIQNVDRKLPDDIAKAKDFDGPLMKEMEQIACPEPSLNIKY
jgi:hypothetical protein